MSFKLIRSGVKKERLQNTVQAIGFFISILITFPSCIIAGIYYFDLALWKVEDISPQKSPLSQ